MKLTGKIFISGYIVAETGLHIGGAKTALDIGGIDLNVIKTSRGIPFIPGSSLKGKLRTILAREEGSDEVENDSPIIKSIFGDAGKASDTGIPARLSVRDAYLDEVNFKDEFDELELEWTESKWENTIDRKVGKANPRQLERVPAGARFSFEMVYNVFDDGMEKTHLNAIRKSMRILEDDYLGGQGSRGYGKIKFEQVVFEEKTIDIYMGENKRREHTFSFTGG